jgi:hypothetical protein
MKKPLFLFIHFLFYQRQTHKSCLLKKDYSLHCSSLTNILWTNGRDAGKTIFTNIERPSNIWTRAVYYEGLMALYKIDKHAINIMIMHYNGGKNINGVCGVARL